MTELSAEDSVRLYRARPYIYALRGLLEFKGAKHYEGYHISGLYHELEGELEKAHKCFERSISIINRYSEDNKANYALARDKNDIERSLKRLQQKSNMQTADAGK